MSCDRILMLRKYFRVRQDLARRKKYNVIVHFLYFHIFLIEWRVFCKNRICNFFLLHELFWCASSDFLIEWIIFHKNYICDFSDTLTVMECLDMILQTSRCSEGFFTRIAFEISGSSMNIFVEKFMSQISHLKFFSMKFLDDSITKSKRILNHFTNFVNKCQN